MGGRARRRRAFTGAAVVVAAALAAVVGSAPVSGASRSRDTSRAAVPRVIIDSDLSRWWDDATAIGMANVLDQRGEVRLLGVLSDIRNPEAVAAIDAIDTAYGHGAIPVGAVADSDADTAPHGYSDLLAARLPHRVRDADDAPAAVPLLRRLLAGQPDHSVTIVAIGAYTNLAGVLGSKAGDGSSLDGRQLLAAKVKRTVIEDGLFPNGTGPLTNEALDLAAARAVVAAPGGWPTPLAWVDGFTGIQTRVGGALCTTTPPDNPMRVVYQAEFGCGPPGDGDWDGPTLLYAVGGPEGQFAELGRGGTAVLDAQGGLTWQAPSTRPDDVYVHVTDQAGLNQRIDALLEAR